VLKRGKDWAVSHPDKPQELRSILVAKLPLMVNGVCTEVLSMLSLESKKKSSKPKYGVCLARVKHPRDSQTKVFCNCQSSCPGYDCPDSISSAFGSR
jgi:hypothetical protein